MNYTDKSLALLARDLGFKAPPDVLRQLDEFQVAHERAFKRIQDHSRDNLKIMLAAQVKNEAATWLREGGEVPVFKTLPELTEQYKSEKQIVKASLRELILQATLLARPVMEGFTTRLA